MSKEIWTYNGEKPEIIRPQDIAKILDLMLKQLEILSQMTCTSIFVPASTDLRREVK